MNKQTEEMVALGAAYALNCGFCMEYHKQKAIEAGLTLEEMKAAIRVAEGVRSGAHGRTRQNADALFGDVKEERCCTTGSECCP